MMSIFPDKFYNAKKIAGILLLSTLHSLIAVGSNLEAVSPKTLTKKIKKNHPPFRGQKKFCSDEGRQTYTVTIKGYSIVLSNSSAKIKGIFKNGLLFTNDPDEISYRRYAKKHNYGKYYMIDKDYLNVLNGETGEYFFYTRCDKK
jgi:hypothetical protein